LATLIGSLEIKPVQGTPLDRNCYKIRMAISSKGMGKRGGGRLINYIAIAEEAVYLLSIYDKSEKEHLTDKELQELLKNVIE
jgi:hypothetical protein